MLGSSPGSGTALDRLEDEIDAYVCAYVALYYWTHGPRRCRVFGNLESGYIVTPVLPTRYTPLDEPVPLNRSVVPGRVKDYSSGSISGA